MRRIGKLFAVLLCLLAALALLPLRAGAETVASGTCGRELTWTLDGEGTLTISGRGTMYHYLSSDPPWRQDGLTEQVRRLVVEDGVTSIGEGAFDKCVRLEQAEIAGSVKDFCSWAFYYCPALKAVTMPGDARYATDPTRGIRCFGYCDALEELTLTTDVSDSFAQNFCPVDSAIERVTVTGEASRVGPRAFTELKNLKELTLGSGVTELQNGAARGCSQLETVRGGEGVRTVWDDVFSAYSPWLSKTGPVVLGSVLLQYNSDGSPTMTVPASVTTIHSSAFKGNTDLETADLPEGLEEIGSYAFYGCTALRELAVPGTVTAIGNSAFFGCTALETVDLRPGLEEIGSYAFSGCSALKTLTLPGTVTALGARAFERCESLPEITVPGTVTEMGDHVFSGCTALKTAVLSPGLESVSRYAFFQCTGLTRAELPEGLTGIGNSAFSGCTALEMADLPEGLERIEGDAFCSCAALRTVHIPASVTLLESGAFSGCNGLEELRLDCENARCSGKVFSAAGETEARCILTLGPGVTQLAPSLFSGASQIRELRAECPLDQPYNSLFQNMKGLEKAVLTGSCPALGRSAFYGCTALRDLTLPEDLETLGDNCFSGCTALETVPLPEGVTDIGDGCFQNCAALKQVPLPAGLTRLGQNAFAGCPALEGTERSGGAVVLDGWAIGLYTGDGPDLVLPAGTVGTADDLAGGSGANTGAFTRLLLPEGLRYIGSWSFANMKNLASVNLPDSLLRVGERAFYGCGKLTEAEDSPAAVTVEADAFLDTPLQNETEFLILGAVLVHYQGSDRTEVTVPQGVASIGYRAFADHSELTKVNLPAGLKEVGQEAFSDCSALTELRLPAGLETVGPSAFLRTGLTEITVPGSVTAVSAGAFAGCGAMKTAVLEEGVNELGEDAFSGCGKLERVGLPRSLRIVGTRAFASTALTEIDLPAGTALGDKAFAGCPLTKLTFDGEPADFLPLVRKYGQVLRGTPIQEAVINGWYHEDSPGSLYNENALTFSVCRTYARSLLERGEVGRELRSVYDWMCANCSYSYGIGQGLSTADGPFFDGVASCNGVALAMKCFLDELGYPNFIMEGMVTGTYGRVGHAWNEVGPAFCIVDATDTKKGDYSTYMISNDKANEGFRSGDLNIHYEFSMETLYAKEAACLEAHDPAVTSAQPLTFTEQADGSLWVTGCENVAGTVAIPETWDGQPVTGIGPGAFRDRAFLTHVTVPEGVRSVGNDAFRGCLGLEDIVLPSALETLGNNVFAGCVSLERADFSGSRLTRLPAGTFTRCLSLWELRLPECLTDASGMKVPANDDLVNSTDGTWRLDVYGYSGSPAEKTAAELGYAFHSLGQYDPLARLDPAETGAALVLSDALGREILPLPADRDILDVSGDGRADRLDGFRMIFGAFPEEGDGALSRLVMALYDPDGRMTGSLVLRDGDMAAEQDLSALKGAAEVRLFFLNSDAVPLRAEVTAVLSAA